MKKPIIYLIFVFVLSMSCKKSEDNPAPAKSLKVDVFAASPDYSHNQILVNFRNPQGIARDASGNFYVADTDNSRIVKISSDSLVSDVTYLNKPTALALDASGNLYVVCMEDHLIYKVDVAGTATVFAGSGTAGFVNGTGSAASFNFPSGIVLDAEGNAYVTDRYNDAIRKITPQGEVSTYASSEDQDIGVDALPYGITIDGEGNLYVAGNSEVWKIAPDKTTSKAYKGVSRFVDNAAIALDESGNLFVTDIFSWLIYKIDKKGNVSQYYGIKRTALDSRQLVVIRECYGLAIADGFLYVTNTPSNMILRLKK